MKYLIILIYTNMAFAECGAMVKKEFVIKMLNNIAPHEAISVNCKGPDCLCVPVGVPVSIPGFSQLDIDENNVLTINPVKKQKYDSEVEAKIEARKKKFQDLKDAELEESIKRIEAKKAK